MSLADFPDDIISYHIVPYVCSAFDTCALRATSKKLSALFPLPPISLQLCQDDSSLPLRHVLRICSSVKELRLTPELSKTFLDHLEKNTTLKSIQFHCKKNFHSMNYPAIISQCENLENFERAFGSMAFHPSPLPNHDFIQALSSRKHLTSLTMPGAFPISREDLEVLLLRPDCVLKRLSLRGHTVNSDGIPSISQFLSTSTTIQYLNLSMMALRASSAECIADGLGRNRSLKSFIYSGNYPGKDGITALTEAACRSSTLTELSLCGDYTMDCAPQLAKIISESTSIREFKLGSHDMGSLSMVLFANALNRNTTLRDLDLIVSNTIDPKGALHLGNAIAQNRTLTSFSFRSHCEFRLSAAGFMDGLKACPTLTKIVLSQLEFDENYTSQLCAGLSKCTNLTSLEVSFSILKPPDCAQLVRLCNIMPSLQRLDVNANRVNEKKFELMMQPLRMNTTLRELNFSKNSLRNPGCSLLAEFLAVNYTLERLELHDNHISLDGVKSLAQALRDNTTLTFLDLTMNEWDGFRPRDAQKLFAGNRTVEILM